MFVNYRTQGFILKKENRGEADELLTIYTKDFGKLEILGKAIRKISSKLRSGIEIFYLSEIEFIQGKTYKTLTDALLINKFENIRKDLKRLKIAYQIISSFNELIKGQEPDEKLWQFLLEIFEQLNNLNFSISNFQLIYYYFLWNFFSILGYEPDLYHCSFCQKKIILEKLFFNLKGGGEEGVGGGIICQQCQKFVKSIKEVKVETIKILRIILKKDWNLLKRLKIEKLFFQELKEISKNYLFFIQSH